MNILDKIREGRNDWIVLRERNGWEVGMRIFSNSVIIINLSYKIPGENEFFQSHLIRIEHMSRIVHEFRWDRSYDENIAIGLMIQNSPGTVIEENGDILRRIR